MRAGGVGVDVGEGLVGVGAQRGDGGDAHHDNEGQHDGVLHGRGAVFPLEELQGPLCDMVHGSMSVLGLRYSPKGEPFGFRRWGAASFGSRGGLSAGVVGWGWAPISRAITYAFTLAQVRAGGKKTEKKVRPVGR